MGGLVADIYLALIFLTGVSHNNNQVLVLNRQSKYPITIIQTALKGDGSLVIDVRLNISARNKEGERVVVDLNNVFQNQIKFLTSLTERISEESRTEGSQLIVGHNGSVYQANPEFGWQKFASKNITNIASYS